MKIKFFLIFIIIILSFTNISYCEWIEEEKVISEEKEKLSFFDMLDGKKAKTIKKTKILKKWLKQDGEYVKNDFVYIPIDENYAYKYYFDSEGYLITDNISKDWTILDNEGREIDNELNPIKYYIGDKNLSIDTEEENAKQDVYTLQKDKNINSTPSQIILSTGVVLKNKFEKIFDNQIDKDMTKYIVGGKGYKKDVNGIIKTKSNWKKALRLQADGSFIVFNNYMNNFNKITGRIAMEDISTSDKSTICKMTVYDKNLYDKGYIDENIYETINLNETGVVDFEFTFDRSITNIIFILSVDGKYKTRSIYFKNLKYAFSKSAYKEELIRKKEEKEEIDYLKSLGIYVEDDNIFDTIDEDGELVEEIDEEETDEIYDEDEYFDEMIDRNTGPAFDTELKNKQHKKYGPYYDIVGTNSDIKKNGIIYQE